MGIIRNSVASVAVVAALAGGAYLYSIQNHSVQDNDLQGAASPDGHGGANSVATTSVTASWPPPRSEQRPVTEKTAKAASVPAPDISVAERTQREQRAQALRGNIDDLMTEFDANRFDRDARLRLKSELKSKMAEYNEAVLPLALSAMAEQADNSQPR